MTKEVVSESRVYHFIGSSWMYLSTVRGFRPKIQRATLALGYATLSYFLLLFVTFTSFCTFIPKDC